jgi:hypothetical protein
MSDGSVRKYDLSKMRGITDLHNKIQNSVYKSNISQDAMSQLSQLANNVRQENLYDTKSAAFDAGIFTFTMYNTIDKTETILGYVGNQPQLNSSATELIVYLAELTDMTHFPGFNVIKNLTGSGSPTYHQSSQRRPVIIVKQKPSSNCNIF